MESCYSNTFYLPAQQSDPFGTANEFAATVGGIRKYVYYCFMYDYFCVFVNCIALFTVLFGFWLNKFEYCSKYTAAISICALYISKYNRHCDFR